MQLHIWNFPIFLVKGDIYEFLGFIQSHSRWLKTQIHNLVFKTSHICCKMHTCLQGVD